MCSWVTWSSRCRNDASSGLIRCMGLSSRSAVAWHYRPDAAPTRIRRPGRARPRRRRDPRRSLDVRACSPGLGDATGFDARGCEGYVGTSAGSIVAAALVAGIEPGSRLGELARAAARGRLRAGRRARRCSAGRCRPASRREAPSQRRWRWPGCDGASRAGALLRRAALAPRAGRAPLARSSSGARSTGPARAGTGACRSRPCEVETGRRVMFGTPGRAPGVGRRRGAGLLRDPGSVPPARARRSQLRRRRRMEPDQPGPGPGAPGNAGPVPQPDRVDAAEPGDALRRDRDRSRSVAAVEALALRRRGAHVTIVAPDTGSLAAMGPNLMDAGPRARVIAAGLAQGQARAVALLTSGVAASKASI